MLRECTPRAQGVAGVVLRVEHRDGRPADLLHRPEPPVGSIDDHRQRVQVARALDDVVGCARLQKPDHPLQVVLGNVLAGVPNLAALRALHDPLSLVRHFHAPRVEGPDGAATVVP